jgi:hypothetical protein
MATNAAVVSDASGPIEVRYVSPELGDVDGRVQDAAQNAMEGPAFDLRRDIRGNIVLWSPVFSDPDEDEQAYHQYVDRQNRRIQGRMEEMNPAIDRPADLSDIRQFVGAAENDDDAVSLDDNEFKTELVAPQPREIVWDPSRLFEETPTPPPRPKSV